MVGMDFPYPVRALRVRLLVALRRTGDGSKSVTLLMAANAWARSATTSFLRSNPLYDLRCYETFTERVTHSYCKEVTLSVYSKTPTLGVRADEHMA